MGADAEGLDDMAAAKLLPGLLRRLAQTLRLPRLGERVDGGELAAQCEIMAREALASDSPARNPRKVGLEDIARLYREAL